MKVEITVEQFDNGISIKWRHVDGDTGSEAIVALERDQANAIGKTIWEDIKSLMDYKLTPIVKMTIDYQAIREEE